MSDTLIEVITPAATNVIEVYTGVPGPPGTGGGGGGTGAWADITGKPSTFPPTIGSGAAQAVAGNDARLTDARTPLAHGHVVADTTGLQAALDGKQAAGSYAAATHGHAQADVTGLVTALAGKQAAGSYAPATHTHATSDVTGLDTALTGKADTATTYTRTAADARYIRTVNSTAPDGSGNVVVTGSAPTLRSTSTSNVILGVGTKTFALVTPTNLTVGMFVEARGASATLSYVAGLITAISGSSVTINALYSFDNDFDGALSSWVIQIVGVPGVDGPQGIPGTSQTFAEHFDFGFSGVLSVRSGAFFQVSPNAACTIKEILLVAGTQPTGGNIQVDVKSNGSTIFGSPANRPFIAPGAAYAYGNGTGLNIALPARSRLSVDITNVGGTIAGSDLSVQIVYTRN